MEEDKMITGNSETVIDKKQALFRTLVPLINEKIGRETDPYEEEAIAFAVEESFQGPITTEDFLSGIFGVKEGEVGRDVAMKIHNSVYEAKMRKLDRLIEDNPSDAARLKEIKTNIDIGHNQTLANYRNSSSSVYIGNVQEEWIPPWYSTLNASFGQDG